MANIDWMIRGQWLVTCNCDVGCPCQFNSRPTHGNCRGMLGVEIKEGYFGDVRLDGLRFCGLYAWPKAIHEGGGEAQPIVDESATAEQRTAILTIMKGEETEPGATVFNVFAATLDQVHDPLFVPIEFRANIEAREGRISMPGVLEVTAEPIRNPMMGDEHRVRIDIPNGFEYTIAEVASGAAKTGERARIALDWRDSHSHFVDLHLTRQGVVR